MCRNFGFVKQVGPVDICPSCGSDRTGCTNSSPTTYQQECNDCGSWWYSDFPEGEGDEE